MKTIGKRFGWMLALGLVATLTLLFAAGCGDDDENGNGNGDETPAGDETPVATEDGNGNGDEDTAEVEDVFTQTFESDATNAEYFFAHVTDNLIETVLFAPSREECEANAEECIGDPSTVESIEGTTIDGDTATLVVTTDFGVFEIGMIREDGVWKVDTFQAASDDIPEGAEIVDLALGDFVFGFDETAFPSDGNFGFRVNNAGAQVHEVVVVPVPADVDLMEAVEGIEDPSVAVGFKAFIVPGQELDMAFEAPLEPGRYALVCFFPDTSSPEMTSHAELGMIDEFTIE